MPFYDFECPDGHRTIDRFEVGKRPASIPCHCGKRAKRVMPKAVFKFGASMKHVSDDDGEMEARLDQKELCEWRIAMGVASGATGKGSMGPTAAGVKEKQERIKRGEQVPENYTYGVDMEKLNGQAVANG